MANGQQTAYDGCMPLPSRLVAILFVTGTLPVGLTLGFVEKEADGEGSQDVNYESGTRGHGVWQRALALAFGLLAGTNSELGNRQAQLLRESSCSYGKITRIIPVPP